MLSLTCSLGAIFDHIVDNAGNTTSFFGSSAGSKAMLFLFCLAGFFLNFGPNTTSFIIPAEAFPTRYRATCHGIAAASGKVGAILSQFLIIGLVSKPFIMCGVYLKVHDDLSYYISDCLSSP